MYKYFEINKLMCSQTCLLGQPDSCT